MPAIYTRNMLNSVAQAAVGNDNNINRAIRGIPFNHGAVMPAVDVAIGIGADIWYVRSSVLCRYNTTTAVETEMSGVDVVTNIREASVFDGDILVVSGGFLYRHSLSYGSWEQIATAFGNNKIVVFQGNVYTCNGANVYILNAGKTAFNLAFTLTYSATSIASNGEGTLAFGWASGTSLVGLAEYNGSTVKYTTLNNTGSQQTSLVYSRHNSDNIVVITKNYISTSSIMAGISVIRGTSRLVLLSHSGTISSATSIGLSNIIETDTLYIIVAYTFYNSSVTYRLFSVSKSILTGVNIINGTGLSISGSVTTDNGCFSYNSELGTVKISYIPNGFYNIGLIMNSSGVVSCNGINVGESLEIGIGTEALSIDNYKLDIPSGLTKSIAEIKYNYDAEFKPYRELRRSFTNDSGASLTIREAGLYNGSYLTSREVYTTPFTLAVGQTVTIKYITKMTID